MICKQLILNCIAMLMFVGYGLVINKDQDYVSVGDKPEYSCSVKKDASFLITHPLKWEWYGYDGSRLVISTFGNVKVNLESEYYVDLDITDAATTLTLKFPQGVKKEYDGNFKCVLYDTKNVVLAEKKVSVHVG